MLWGGHTDPLGIEREFQLSLSKNANSVGR